MGASYHQEYWIPAEELAELNRSIVGAIEVVRSFTGRQPPDAAEEPGIRPG